MKNKYAEIWNKSHAFWANTQTVEYDNWMFEYEKVINNAVNIIDLGCGGSSASNTRYLLSLNKNVIIYIQCNKNNHKQKPRLII